MKIYRQAEVNKAHRGAVVMIGNFDGFHRGHMALYKTARAYTQKQGISLGLLTFSPHPRMYFARTQKPEPFLLAPAQLKADILHSYGFDFMVEMPFDQEFAEISAHAFVDRILINKLGVAAVAIGENFGYGKGREGNITSLKQVDQFETLVVPEASSDDANTVYSSTGIRSHLKNGNIVMANDLMLRPFTIKNRVFLGQRMGRELGFPTANIRPMDDQILPKFGVYAGRVMLHDGRLFDAAINWGIRPTMRQQGAMYEAHLFEFDEDLYDQSIRIALLDYLRPEQKFDGIDALSAQIAKDCELAASRLTYFPKDSHLGVPISAKLIDPKMITGYQRTQIEAAVFRRLMQHLQARTDVQNIDLMLLANFCRNCFSKWYVDAASDIGCGIDKETAREIVYGMAYDVWKQRYQTEQRPEKIDLLQDKARLSVNFTKE